MLVARCSPRTGDEPDVTSLSMVRAVVRGTLEAEVHVVEAQLEVDPRRGGQTLVIGVTRVLPLAGTRPVEDRLAVEVAGFRRGRSAPFLSRTWSAPGSGPGRVPERSYQGPISRTSRTMIQAAVTVPQLVSEHGAGQRRWLGNR